MKLDGDVLKTDDDDDDDDVDGVDDEGSNDDVVFETSVSKTIITWKDKQLVFFF